MPLRLLTGFDIKDGIKVKTNGYPSPSWIPHGTLYNNGKCVKSLDLLDVLADMLSFLHVCCGFYLALLPQVFCLEVAGLGYVSETPVVPARDQGSF